MAGRRRGPPLQQQSAAATSVLRPRIPDLETWETGSPARTAESQETCPSRFSPLLFARKSAGQSPHARVGLFYCERSIRTVLFAPMKTNHTRIRAAIACLLLAALPGPAQAAQAAPPAPAPAPA